MWGNWIFTAPDGRKHKVDNGPTWHKARADAAIALGVEPNALACENEPVDHNPSTEPVDVWASLKPKPKPELVEVVAPCGCVCHVESPRGMNGPTLAVVDMCRRHRRAGKAKLDKHRRASNAKAKGRKR